MDNITKEKWRLVVREIEGKMVDEFDEYEYLSNNYLKIFQIFFIFCVFIFLVLKI